MFVFLFKNFYKMNSFHAFKKFCKVKIFPPSIFLNISYIWKGPLTNNIALKYFNYVEMTCDYTDAPADCLSSFKSMFEILKTHPGLLHSLCRVMGLDACYGCLIVLYFCSVKPTLQWFYTSTCALLKNDSGPMLCFLGLLDYLQSWHSGLGC